VREFTKFIGGIVGFCFAIVLILTGFALLLSYLNWLGKVLKF
jgi:hypothetical protein